MNEHSNSPSSQVSENKKPVEADKPLKGDVFDAIASYMKTSGGKIFDRVSFMASMPAIVLAEVQRAHGGPLENYLPLIPVAVYPIGRWLFTTDKFEVEQKSKETREFMSDIGYNAWRMVYKGKEPLKAGSVELKNGDNFFHISLPEPEAKREWSSEELAFFIELYDFSLGILKDSLKGKDYKAVAIEMPIWLPNIAKNFARVDRESLFKDKKLEVLDGKEIMLTREEFESLMTSPREVFLKAVEALGDKRFSDTLQAVLKEYSPEKRDSAVKILTERLYGILTNQVGMYFNSPEMIAGKDELNNPTRRKVYSTINLKKTDNGYLFVKITPEIGEFRSEPLGRKLGINKESAVEDIINSDSRYKKAQLAFIIEGMVKEDNFFEELLRNRDKKNADELRARMKELGITVVQGTLEKSLSVAERMVKPKPMQKHLNKVRYALTALFIYAAFHYGINFVQEHWSEFEKFNIFNIKIFDQQLFGKNDSAYLGNELNHSPSFPKGVPKHSLDWKIKGNMPSDGYWIMSTFNTFTDGAWMGGFANRTTMGDVGLNLPDKIEEKPSYINISKYVTYKDGDALLKIPIKEGTTISAVNVAALGGEKISRFVSQEPDGTIWVHVNAGAVEGTTGTVKLTYQLVPSGAAGESVHALGKINPIDFSKLSPKAKKIITLAQANSAFRSSSFIDELAREIREDHKYSINPEGRAKVENAKTPEEYINAVADLKSCDCDVCNSALALASSLSTEKSYTNIAYGYNNMPGSLAGAGGNFLRGETRHAFGIDNNGRIIDSTPGIPADDWETLEYIKMLHGNGSGINTEEAEWQAQMEYLGKSADRQREVETALKVLAGMLGGLAAWQVAKLIRRNKDKLDVGKLKDDFLLKFIKEKDLKQAYNFLTWVSYGDKSKNTSNVSTAEFSDKKEILEELKRNTDYGQLASYLENPKLFENQYSLPKRQRLRMRSFAQYLLWG